jgi:hypothetical protein
MKAVIAVWNEHACTYMWVYVVIYCSCSVYCVWPKSRGGAVHERTKITNSNQSHKSYRKYKSENGRTRAFEYIRGGIRSHGGVSFPCQLLAPAVRPISNVKFSSQNSVHIRNNACQNQSNSAGKQRNPLSKSVSSSTTLIELHFLRKGIGFIKRL